MPASEDVHVEALGNLAVGGAPARRDSIFRIASMTKPITAAATLAVIAEGALELDELVDRLLPELADRRVLRRVDGPLQDTVPATRSITTRDLLSREAVRAMTSDQLSAAQKAHGGLLPGFFDGRSWGFCQAVYEDGSYAWDGGLGVSWLVDPTNELVVIVMTQRMFENPETPLIHRDIRAAAYSALA